MTLTGAFAFAQESIRVDVCLVTVAFSVRDANGALVDDLTRMTSTLPKTPFPKKSRTRAFCERCGFDFSSIRPAFH